MSFTNSTDNVQLYNKIKGNVTTTYDHFSLKENLLFIIVQKSYILSPDCCTKMKDRIRLASTCPISDGFGPRSCLAVKKSGCKTVYDDFILPARSRQNKKA